MGDDSTVIELCGKIADVLAEQPLGDAFTATSILLLDVMADYLTGDDDKDALLHINAFHTAFLDLMASNGYDISSDNIH